MNKEVFFINGNTVKNTVLAIFAGIGSLFVRWLGGWDLFLKTLVMFMIIDYITGIAVAFVFHKSDKTENGSASSKECYKGIVKKMCMLALVGVSVAIDGISGTAYVRSATIFFFIGNEGLSIIENIGLMGLKYPSFIKKALEIMKEKGDNEDERI